MDQELTWILFRNLFCSNDFIFTFSLPKFIAKSDFNISKILFRNLKSIFNHDRLRFFPKQNHAPKITF